MRDDDDDTLAGYDLSAWGAPEPSANLADLVVARLNQPPPVGAIDPAQRAMRRWWIAVGIGMAVAAGGGFALWGLHRAPASGGGDVIATEAKHLELGPSTAELDPGAEVRWRRDHHRIAVAQLRGAATWRVGGDDTMVIDAGATSASVASVEATGASLRVEVKMNLSDARMIGASAVTAAAVAMVTVIVYEGHVKATSGGQTVNVAPGTAFDFRPPGPKKNPVAVGVDLDERTRLLNAIQDQDRQISELTARLRTVEPAPCDEVSCVLSNNEGECCTKLKQQPAKKENGCDAEALKNMGLDLSQDGLDRAAFLAFEASDACAPEPYVVKLAFVAACKSKNRIKAKRFFARIPVDQQGALSQICLMRGINPSEDDAGDAPDRTDLPDSLTRVMINEGVFKVKDRVLACRNKSSATGQVKLSVTVDSDGNVGKVEIRATPDPALGSCAAAEMQKASFAKTRAGGSFTYPFVF